MGPGQAMRTFPEHIHDVGMNPGPALVPFIPGVGGEKRPSGICENTAQHLVIPEVGGKKAPSGIDHEDGTQYLIIPEVGGKKAPSGINYKDGTQYLIIPEVGGEKLPDGIDQEYGTQHLVKVASTSSASRKEYGQQAREPSFLKRSLFLTRLHMLLIISLLTGINGQGNNTTSFLECDSAGLRVPQGTVFNLTCVTGGEEELVFTSNATVERTIATCNTNGTCSFVDSFNGRYAVYPAIGSTQIQVKKLTFSGSDSDETLACNGISCLIRFTPTIAVGTISGLKCGSFLNCPPEGLRVPQFARVTLSAHYRKGGIRWCFKNEDSDGANRIADCYRWMRRCFLEFNPATIGHYEYDVNKDGTSTLVLKPEATTEVGTKIYSYTGNDPTCSIEVLGIFRTFAKVNNAGRVNLPTGWTTGVLLMVALHLMATIST